MISHSSPNPLSEPEGCGQQLRKAREAAGLSVDEVGATLHIAPTVIRALENQDWACLGAPVFVRGQLRSYAAFLGLNPHLVVQQAWIGHIEPPVLVTRLPPMPCARQWAESILRKGVYATITAAFAIPIWFATSHHLQHKALSATALDAPLGLPVESPPPSATSTQAEQPTQSLAALPSDRPPVAPAPYIASMTPAFAKADGDHSLPPQQTTVPQADDQPHEQTIADSLEDLVLNFSGDSWFEVASPTGEALAKTLVHSGEQRRYSMGEVGHIVIGNIDGVEVEHGGVPLDLSRFRHGNVARFSVGSDGNPY